MGFVSGQHLLLLFLLLIVVLIVFGPGKLPDIGGGMGKAIREFRKASSEVKDQVTNSMKDDSHHEGGDKPAPGVSEATPALPEAQRDSASTSGETDQRKVKIGG